MSGTRTEKVVRGHLARTKGPVAQRPARLRRWYSGLLLVFALLFVVQYALNALYGVSMSALPSLVLVVVLLVLRRALDRLVQHGEVGREDPAPVRT